MKTAPFFLLSLLATSCMRVPIPVETSCHPACTSVPTCEIALSPLLDGDGSICSRGEAHLEEELTVEKAVAIALANNPSLKELYENLGIAKAGVRQAGLLTNPIAGFAYQYSQTPLVTNLITASLLQSVIDTLLIPLKKKMAAQELEAVRAFVTAKVLETIADVKIAFFSLQAAENMWMGKQELLLAADAAYDAAHRLYCAGNYRELDLKERFSAYRQAEVDLADAEMALLQARENLNILMGLYGEQITWQASVCLPEIVECEPLYEQVETCAIANSLDLHRLRKQICSTAAALGVDTTKWVFPALDAGVSAEREDSIWYVGPAFALALPIFDWGQAKSCAARAQICQQWNHYTAFAIKVRSAARLARLQVLHSHRKSKYYEDVLIPLAENITTLTLHQHNAMQMGVFALLDAKQQEIIRKMEAVDMAKEYWIARTELEMILQGHVRDN